MSVALAEKIKYTYKDYLQTPDDERYELIEGELIMSPAPYTKHQIISGNIAFELRKFVQEHNLGAVLYAPCDVYFDDENVFEPDILFISNENADIITKKNIQGPPDLVIEILSESNAYKDLVQKKRLYAKFGVKEYWIVIPEEKLIEVYILKDKFYQIYNIYDNENTLESVIIKELKIELKEIFQ